MAVAVRTKAKCLQMILEGPIVIEALPTEPRVESMKKEPKERELKERTKRQYKPV